MTASTASRPSKASAHSESSDKPKAPKKAKPGTEPLKASKTAKPAKPKTPKVAAIAAPLTKTGKRATAGASVRRTEPAAEETRRGIGTRTQWLLGAVLGVLAFQIVHSAEHVAQATYWLFNPTVAPWMSAWAMGLVNGLAALFNTTPPLGMEILHLIGNAIFLAGLLLALRLPEQYKNPQMLRWLRIATVVEALHLLEHVLLTASVALAGKAIGLSTMFGALTAGTPAAAGYRVVFHLAVNLIALVFAVKALLAVRDERLAAAGRTPTGFDWRRTAILFAPVAGLIFLLPIFQGHIVHAAAEGDAVVATVNGQDITNAELTGALDIARVLSGAPQLGVALVPGVGEEGGMSEEELTFTTLNRLVQNALVEQNAAELGISVQPAEVEARKTELITNDFGDREAFEAYLAERGATEDYADTQVEFLLLQERVFQYLTQDAVIDDQNVQAVFAADYAGLPQGRQLMTQTEDLANQFLARVEGGANFEELILNESTDPRAPQDRGYTGTIQDGAQVPEIVEAIGDMRDGELTVVRSQFGWHVLQRLAPPTLPEVEAEIREKLLLNQQADAGQAWLAEIRAEALVSLSPGYGVWNTTYGAVVSPDFTG